MSTPDCQSHHHDGRHRQYGGAVPASLDDHQDRSGNAISATRAIAAYTAHRTSLTLAFLPHGSHN
jgi:hypothetical protein